MSTDRLTAKSSSLEKALLVFKLVIMYLLQCSGSSMIWRMLLMLFFSNILSSLFFFRLYLAIYLLLYSAWRERTGRCIAFFFMAFPRKTSLLIVKRPSFSIIKITIDDNNYQRLRICLFQLSCLFCDFLIKYSTNTISAKVIGIMICFCLSIISHTLLSFLFLVFGLLASFTLLLPGPFKYELTSPLQQLFFYTFMSSS